MHGLPTKLGEVSEDTFFYVHRETEELRLKRPPKNEVDDYLQFHRYKVRGIATWYAGKRWIGGDLIPDELPKSLKLYLTLSEG